MTRCERVYAIFKTLDGLPNVPLMEAWQKTFRTEDVFDTYFYLEKLHGEIERLKAELSKLGVPSKIYEPVLNRADALTRNYNFSIMLYNVKPKPETLAQFYGFSFQGENEETVELDLFDDLAVMLDSLDELENGELKLILADVVSSFHRLQTLPKIVGKVGLEDAFRALYCKVSAHVDEINEAPKAYKEKLIELYTYVDRVLSFGQKWLGRGEKIADLLEQIT